MRQRLLVLISAAALWSGAYEPARAQDNQNAEQLKKMYDDVLQQLNASQERKNQLAAENERLVQQIDAANKEKAAMQQRLEELKRADAGYAERTLFLRSHYMVWQQFTTAYPDVNTRWREYIQTDFLSGPSSGQTILEKNWVFERVYAEADAATRPSTQPATQPSSTQSTTQPSATQPAATQPTSTQSTATQPASTQPAATQAATSQAATSQPATSQPADSSPGGTQPATTQPAATQPAT